MAKRAIEKRRPWIFYVSIGVILIILYKLLDNFTAITAWLGKLFGIISPFLGAILVSYILFVPCRKVEKLLNKKLGKHKKAARNLSITIVYVVTLILIILLLRFILPSMWASIKDLISNLEYYYNTINNDEINISWAPQFNEIGPRIQEYVLKPLVEFIKALNWGDIFTPDLLKTYLSSTINVVKVIANIFVSIICSIYILGERTDIIKFFARWVQSATTSKRYLKIRKYFVSGSEIFFTFLTTQLIDGAIIGTLLAIAFELIGIKYGILLGYLIGLFNLIPFFGPIIAVVVAALLTILTSGWKKALIMAIVATILSQIDSHIINPKLTGSRLKISPLLVIISVSVGGSYFGVFGMFLAVPIASLIKVIIDDRVNDRFVLRKQREGKRFKENDNKFFKNQNKNIANTNDNKTTNTNEKAKNQEQKKKNN